MKDLRRAFTECLEPQLPKLLDRLHFLDESGAHLGMTRLYGRAQPGQRVVEGTPGYSGAHYTLVAALSLAGVSAPWVIEGAMDQTAFEAYIHHVLRPTLQPGDMVVLDNLSAHKGASVQTWLEAQGVQVVFLPPYSSDFNPIELCWAKVKAALRKAKARTFDALIDALREALHSVTLDDALAWFTHCGYALNS